MTFDDSDWLWLTLAVPQSPLESARVGQSQLESATVSCSRLTLDLPPTSFAALSVIRSGPWARDSLAQGKNVLITKVKQAAVKVRVFRKDAANSRYQVPSQRTWTLAKGSLVNRVLKVRVDFLTKRLVYESTISYNQNHQTFRLIWSMQCSVCCIP